MYNMQRRQKQFLFSRVTQATTFKSETHWAGRGYVYQNDWNNLTARTVTRIYDGSGQQMYRAGIRRIESRIFTLSSFQLAILCPPSLNQTQSLFTAASLRRHVG